jgi:glycosyltransferase involved in cell wall biosynthesis
MRADFQNISEEKLMGVKFPDIHTWHLHIEKNLSGSNSVYLGKKFASVLFSILKPLIFLYEILFLYFLFLTKKADIVHINNGGYPGSLSCRAAVLAARLAGKKNIILSVHSLVQRKRGIFDFIVDFFVRRSVSSVVSVSEASGLTLSADVGFGRNKITNIYNGISENDAIKIVHAERRISMVARFDNGKGHEIAIRALKKLIIDHPEFSDVIIVFMGDGSLLSRMKDVAAREGLEKNVMFMGHRSDCLNLVALSLFLVNPSEKYDSLPYSIIESMSLGIPAIGTSVGGIPEEIEDGVTGLIVPPGDVDALAHAMFSLLSDEKKRYSMGLEAKRRFKRLFTLETMVNNYIALYDKVTS